VTLFKTYKQDVLIVILNVIVTTATHCDTQSEVV
jgi:hypothetical protein